jgi:excisionase family DNA binding protein
MAIPAMTKDILTTADTARLLGVSVRTAQLLIEGGSVPSWKTPGGHRRVYRVDIEALIEGPAPAAPNGSTRVVVIAAVERLRLYGKPVRDASRMHLRGLLRS